MRTVLMDKKEKSEQTKTILLNIFIIYRLLILICNTQILKEHSSVG